MGINTKPMPRLRVSENKHDLSDEFGNPFFWLGDTAWELFHRVNLEEATLYLKNRQEKKFSLIQAVALCEFDGLNTPNVYGDSPLLNNDPVHPNEPYWKYVDEIISLAEKYNLYIGLLPTWGDKVADMWGTGPVIFNPENAFLYGNWLGGRYKDQSNVVWIMGGDRPVTYTGVKSNVVENDLPTWKAMAEGIRTGVGSPLLMSYHPMGGHSSSEFIHDEEWLDVNMMQSGHGSGHDVPVWERIAHDYALSPTKPTLDGEPNYEDHPVNPWPSWDPESGYFDDYDVRKQLYRSVFAGGCGVTYGHHSVWQMASPRYGVINHAKMGWMEALDRPGACQVQYLRSLIESRPTENRLPDQTLVVNIPENSKQNIVSTRNEEGSFTLVYLPTSQPVTVNLGKMAAGQVNAWWYDPRSGRVLLDGKYSAGTNQLFSPPANGPDWVLVLDDVVKKYYKPGWVFKD